MPDKTGIWAILDESLNTIASALSEGRVRWERYDSPPEQTKGTAYVATGKTFKVMCVCWHDRQGQECYNAVATVFSPNICVINVPPPLAQRFYESAVIGQN